MGSSCSVCGAAIIRHLRNSITLRDHIGFEGPLPEDWSFWDKGGWKSMAPYRQERFWLPLTDDLLHEEGMALYTQWTHEIRAAKEQLVVVFIDIGLCKGRDEEPWLGSVCLGAFRGRGLGILEPEKDDEMLWLKRAYLCAADPKAKFKTYRQLGLM